jgi:hypothetical protein
MRRKTAESKRRYGFLPTWDIRQLTTGDKLRSGGVEDLAYLGHEQEKS